MREILFARYVEKIERTALFVLGEIAHDFQTRRITERGKNAVDRDVLTLRIPKLALNRRLGGLVRRNTP
jgi:hypothetical protein